MCFKIALYIKSPTTNITLVWSVTSVYPMVILQTGSSLECLPTLSTDMLAGSSPYTLLALCQKTFQQTWKYVDTYINMYMHI